MDKISNDTLLPSHLITYKKLQEHITLDFNTLKNTEYNKTFTLKKLTKSVNFTKNSAAGPDGIQLLLLKKAPET